MPHTPLAKFQNLLLKTFSFDASDLDFGIYRILNFKRSQIEEFINNRLPQIVDGAFAGYGEAERVSILHEVEVLREGVITAYGADAIDAAGVIQPDLVRFPLGRQYAEVRDRSANVEVADELKNRIYNDLFTFFNRYYDDGDFISRRRRGRDETYAIPYNGEEVMLYWANRDQYYIKTGDRFAAYRFQLEGYRVAVELRSADVETNNNKGDKRFFVLAADNPVKWEPQAGLLAIYFEHRPLTESEISTYGKTDPQDKLNAAAAGAILDRVDDPTLKEALQRTGNGGQQILSRHLNSFSRKNSSDFFIHKNLKAFLTRELDFFLKNDALLLDELLAGGETSLGQHLQRARVIREVAEKIIDFLAQIEDFQRRLFEKKKFVMRTDYSITLDRVPDEFWPEILKNAAQIDEWRHLYGLDELRQQDGLFDNGVDTDFMGRHPSLMVDTRYFTGEFKWRLLEHIENPDDAMNGLLVDSENLQALALLRDKYRGGIRCIYIDPPYNTGGDGFVYKDSYQHSSWLCMIFDRICAGLALLRQDGILACSLDDNESSNFDCMIRTCLTGIVRLGEFIWRTRNTDNRVTTRLSVDHEYVHVFAASGTKLIGRLIDRSDFKNPDNDPRGPYTTDPLTGKANAQARPNLHYKITNPATGDIYDPDPDFGWITDEDGFKEALRDNRIYWPKNPATGNPRKKRFLSETDPRAPISSMAISIKQGEGNQDLSDMFGNKPINFPKPVSVMETILDACADNNDTILDYFAGSGTTGHAVINLNRKDSGKRKYVLVEMGEYFHVVLLPRIKKAVFCSAWKEGKPAGNNGVSHIIKYQTLEQYEDTLNNLELPRQAEGQEALNMFGDDYLLRYMLAFETQGSPSLLNVECLSEPDAYKLKIRQGMTITEQPVDLLETFNYLLGLNVKRLRAFHDGDRVYKTVLGEKDGRRIAVIWRNTRDLEQDETALGRDREFILSTVLPGLLDADTSPDRLFINGVFSVADAEAIEPEFHRLMWGGVA